MPGHRQRPQKKIAPSKGRGRGSTPAARPLQTRQRSGLGLSKSGLERCSSYSKRRRNEYDMADILMSDAKYVERPKVSFFILTSSCPHWSAYSHRMSESSKDASEFLLDCYH